MKRTELDLLTAYFYNYEERLDNAVKDWDLRACRRNLDYVDHLEEIIAKARLEMFRSVRNDIILLLHLDKGFKN